MSYKTKILFVSGDDYAAVVFEDKYKGKAVKYILPELNLQDGEQIKDNGDDYASQIDYEVKEFDVIPNDGLLELLQAIKDDSDYDMLKHSNFYAENSVIGERFKK